LQKIRNSTAAFNSYDKASCVIITFPQRVTRNKKPDSRGGRRHWSPVRIGSLRCNKINSQRNTVGGRGCGSRSHADYVSDRENRVRARLSNLGVFNVYTSKVLW